MRKNDDQTKQSLKKEMHKMGATEEKTIKNENKKDECSKTNENISKKGNFETKTNMQRQKNVKQVPNKKGKGNRQICNSSINFSFREVMDRENKRRKRETNVIGTRKHEEKKKTTDEQIHEQKDIQR